MMSQSFGVELSPSISTTNKTRSSRQSFSEKSLDSVRDASARSLTNLEDQAIHEDSFHENKEPKDRRQAGTSENRIASGVATGPQQTARKREGRDPAAGRAGGGTPPPADGPGRQDR